MEHLHNLDAEMIHLRIDRYEDIFSDFDARPLTERTLSADFIDELKRQLYARDAHIAGITFQIPQSKRNEADELAIRERILAYFKKRLHERTTAHTRVINRSSIMILCGVFGMALASYVSSHAQASSYPFAVLRVLLEPASWFLLWEGSNQRFFRIHEMTPELDLYTKIVKPHADIRFMSSGHHTTPAPDVK